MVDASGPPPAWVADAVFYQIFPDRFARSDRIEQPGPLEDWDAAPTVHGFKGGDLYGIIERLDYVEALGATALYLNPVFASAAPHRYHPYDYLKVDPLLGGDEALRELLDAVHRRGMRLILDGVFNHASRGFWPFHHVLEAGRHSPYRDWFHLNPAYLESDRQLRAYAAEHLGGAIDAEWAAQHGAGTDSLDTLGYRAWWDLPALPKLNLVNPEVREYLLGVAEHWTRFGIDGWRLDVPEEIDDDFWREFRRRVKTINPDAYIVAEVWHLRPELLAGDMHDAFMSYPLAEALASFLGGGRLATDVVESHDSLRSQVRAEDGPTFAARLERVMHAYPPNVTAAQLNIIGSHDTPRFATICGDDRAALRMAVLAQATLPGAPCVYYGDELMMLGRKDPDCRRAFPRDPEATDPQMLAHYRSVLRLRHANPVLRHGAFAIAGASGDACAYARTDDSAAFCVALNAGEESATLEVELPGFDGRRLVPVSLPGWMDGTETTVNGERAGLELPPRQGLVLRVT